MDPTVPVTEAEMTGFFARVTTSFVSLSRQAQELEEVKKQVASLYDQVTQLRGENATLHKERDDALQLAVENENRLNDARRHRDDLASRNSVLNETIISRDSRVKELEGLLTSAKLDSEDWQRKHEYISRVESDLRTTLVTVREARESWRSRAEDAEKALAEANEKIAAIEKQVGTILGLARPQAVEVPASQPDPTSGGQTGAEQSSQPGTPAPSPSVEPTRPWFVTLDDTKAAE